jgi:hypothetical protein
VDGKMDQDTAIKFIKEVIKSTDKNAEITDEEAVDIINAAAEPVDDNWDNILEMIDDIREYAKQNGRRIISEDRPLSFRVGFRCITTSKTWSVLMSNIYNTLRPDNADDIIIKSRKELIMNCLPSKSGRMILMGFLNNKQ